MIMEFIFLAVGLVLGIFLGIIFKPRIKTAGSIVVDETNPEKDIYTFEFDIAPALINEQKKVIFRIRKKNT